MIWIIIGYMWLFLHRPFEIWTWMGTLRFERVYMIITLIAWLAISEKRAVENRINFAVIVFALAMTMSTVMSPYTNPIDSTHFQNWAKYLVFYVLVVTSVKSEKDLKLLMTGFLFCFFIYMLHSYREYLCGRFHYAMGTRRMIGVDSTLSDPNAFGSSIVILLPMLFPFLNLIKKLKKRWLYLFVICYFLLSVRCIQLTGSRSAFVVMGGAIVLIALLSKHRFTVLPILVLSALIVWVTLPQNLKDRYMTLVDPTINESANESAEGRINGFWDSMDNFSSSPIFGVGPGCHGIAAGTGFLSHILYGQIPSELGLIGIAAFLLLLFCYVMNHVEILGHRKYLTDHGHGEDATYCYLVSYAIVFSVFLLLIFGVGGHNGYRYNWIWYAAFQATAVDVLREKVLLLRRELENTHRQTSKTNPDLSNKVVPNLGHQ